MKSSISWEALAELAEVNGINMTPVPYKSGAAGSDAALGGAVDLSATTLVEATRLIGAGKAQAVLAFSDKPLPQLPGVDVIGKYGKPSEVLDTNIGLTGPPNMSPDAVTVLTTALATVVKDSDFAGKVKNVGLEVEAQPPREWASTLNASFASITKDAPELEKFTAAE